MDEIFPHFCSHVSAMIFLEVILFRTDCMVFINLLENLFNYTIMLADALLFVYDRNCEDRPCGLHIIVLLKYYC